MVLALSCAAAPSFAARVTDVEDAADGDDPFDATIRIDVEGEYQSALITRENTQVDLGSDPNAVPVNKDVKEFEYERYQVRIVPSIEIGLYQDLALRFRWPIVIREEQAWAFAEGTNKQFSTMARDQAPNPAPTVNGWPETAGSGFDAVQGGAYGFPARGYNAWRFDIDQNGSFKAVRAGFDLPVIGLAWSPINNERDDTKPTVTVGVDYNMGILSSVFLPRDPSNDSLTDAAPGAVAHAKHEFHFFVAMSKRMGIFDPYFVVDYWIPFADFAAIPGYQPRQRAGFTTGGEVVPYAPEDGKRKVALYGAFRAEYLGPGRDYSEISDAVGEITFTDQFARFGMDFGLFIRVAEFAFLNIGGEYRYATEHYLTAEEVGTDRDQEGDAGFGVVDLDPDEGERNPYFNPVYDTPGRRLKAADNSTVRGSFTLGFNF